MSDTLTSAELIDIIAPLVAAPNAATPEAAELTGRRIRYWTNLAVLRPVGGTHIGRGRSRFYARADVPVVACLMMLAEADQGVEVLAHVADNIRNMSDPQPLIAGEVFERWQQAISGQGEVVFLFAGVRSRETVYHTRNRGFQLIPASKLFSELNEFAVGVCINLTSAFKFVGVF